MKTLIFIIMASIFTGTTAPAQNNQLNMSALQNEQQIAYQKLVLNVNVTTIDSKDVNARAIKNFTAFCKDAKEVSWYKEKDTSVAFYKTQNGSNRRYYDTKGNFICNILACGESHLPVNVACRVRGIYPSDYYIISAEEIETTVKTFYFVFIENKSNWKKINGLR